MAQAESFLGNGLKYPVEVNQFGRIKTVFGRELIPQSIENILQTPLGSRYFLPEYGSKLHKLLFEPNDIIFKNLSILYIKEPLAIWEKRIKVLSVDVDTSERTISKNLITFEVLQSNEIDSFIYPFYRKLIY